MNQLQIVGKCGLCGGVVSVPRLWFGVGRPPATCEQCGAVRDDTAHLPTLPMVAPPKEHGTESKAWKEGR